MSGKPRRQSASVVPLHPLEAPGALATVRLGRVTGLSRDGQILVDYPGNRRGAQPALSTVRLSAAQIAVLAASREPVLLTFDADQPDRPILFGLTQTIASTATPGVPRALVDGEVVELCGAERVELRCGKARIVLTKEGKVIINGAYISSTSSGAHRIRGGSVEIN